MERKGSGVTGGSFIALGASAGCFVYVIRPEQHGDSKDCHPSALLEPGEKEKQLGPKS